MGRSAFAGAFSAAAFVFLAYLFVILVFQATAYSAQTKKEQAPPPRQEPSKQQSEDPVYDLGPGITPPRIVRQVPPEYSGSRGVRVVGSVTIALVVTSGGLPKDPRVVKSLDKDVDQSAIVAVKQWRFDPAKRNGKPVAVRIALEIDFHSL